MARQQPQQLRPGEPGCAEDRDGYGIPCHVVNNYALGGRPCQPGVSGRPGDHGGPGAAPPPTPRPDRRRTGCGRLIPRVTVKFVQLVPVPPALVTEIGPVEARAGTVVLSWGGRDERAPRVHPLEPHGGRPIPSPQLDPSGNACRRRKSSTVSRRTARRASPSRNSTTAGLGTTL